LLALMLIVPSALAFETERPSGFVDYGTTREDKAYSDGVGSVGLGVHVKYYRENDQERGDYVEFRAIATANTRQVLTYGISTASYSWHTVSNPTYVTGDNEVRWVSFGQYPDRLVRFYGGRGSAEYGGAFVSSNGFISFDWESAERYNPVAIPYGGAPNTFIAPFWRDLDPSAGGSITWGYVAGAGIVISWNSIPNKLNGVPQTFQVVLEAAPGSTEFYRNSRIWCNYESITKDDQTTIGIEDQWGRRGVSYNYQDINNGMTLRFEQTSNSAFIQFLTIKLDKKGDAYADVDIIEDTDPDWIRGYNVRLREETVDDTQRFLVALAGEVTLLLISTGVGAKVGFLLGATAIGLDVVAHLASAQKAANLLEIQDHIDQSYAKAPAYGRPDYLTVVDADFGIAVYWKFSDPNNREHEVTITAKLEYAEVDHTGVVVAYRAIETSVPLRFLNDAGNSLVFAKEISVPASLTGYLGSNDQDDYYKFSVSTEGDSVLNVDMTPALTADFDLEVYSCQGVLIGSSYNRGLGASESIRLNFGSYNNYFYVRVYWISESDIYSLTITISPYNHPGGGGGAGDWPPFPPCLAY